MLKSYFTIALRGLIKNKVFSFINILGLSVGLTAFILIMLYVHFEFSYDDFHKNADNIYRVATKVTLQNEVINHESDTYDGIIKALKADFPEVKAMTVISVFSSEATFIRYQDSGRDLKPIETFRGCYADASFFDVFSFPLTKGNVTAVLDAPYSAVISESLATTYFMGDAVGKVLEFKNDDKPSKRFMITGVVKDVPENSHFKFDVVVNIPDEEVGFWQLGGHAYMLLSSDAIPKEMEHKLDLLAQASNGLKVDKDDYGQVSTFKLQPLGDIHLFSQLDYEFEPGGQGTLVYSLLSLSVIILIIAWVNYVNLSTAISTHRLREIGIRKIVGASKTALIFQVLTESLLFNILSLVIAFALTWITMPLFASFVGVPVNLIPLMDSNAWIATAGFLILGTLFSGGYPAFLISSVYPVRALKGKSGGQDPVFRKGFVIFQFTAASVLMIISVVAYRQLSFMQSRELGINIDQVLVIKALNFDKETWSDEAGGYIVDSVYHEKAALFRNELRQYSDIVNASSVAFVPGEVPVWGTQFKVEDIDPEKAVSMKAIGIDYDFIPTFHVKLIAGRNFSADFPSDQGNEWKRAILINEVAAKRLGFKTPEEAVSRHISTFWDADYEIIGVVNSFHQRSLKENLTPLYFVLQPRALSYFAVNFQTEDIAGTIGLVKKSWLRHFPDYPFNYFFLDEYFGRQYQNERKFGKVVSVFTGLAIFIGCMGLFGLTAYAIVQRTKEIGIRKVLGASVSNVIALFTADFIKLILIANAIAIPLVYSGITWWLDNYAYKISLVWWLFAVPVLVILCIAMATVSLQTIKVARKNPVESLKYE